MIAGDGIGPEISAATKQVLNAVKQVFKLNLEIEDEIAGHESLKKYGATVTSMLLKKVEKADGLILGPISTYDFKDEAKGEINPSKFFRKSWNWMFSASSSTALVLIKSRSVIGYVALFLMG